MRTARRLLVVALFVAALVAGWRFAAANETPPVTVNYVFGRVEGAPLWAVLGVAFAAGVAATSVFALYQITRLSLTARRWRKVAAGLERELHELRNLPLAAKPETAAARRGAGGPPGANGSEAVAPISLAGAPERSARGG
jgi:uncharacterized membrane protein YciS (DUF1049 family)